MQIRTHRTTLHVDDTGAHEGRDTPALVLLHYWGGSSRTWHGVAERLRARFRIVAIDHRGWGESAAPAGGYTMDDLATDAHDVIRALGLARYVLVGHSMGGKAAQLLAARRPAGLEGVVLVAPSPPSPMDVPAGQRTAMVAAYATREGVEQVLDHVLSARPLSAEQRERVIADSLRGAPQAKAAWPEAGMLEDITAEVGAIAVPVYVVAGECDRVERVEVLERELLPRIPGARMTVLPQVGHLVPLEAAPELAAEIAGFVDALPAPAEPVAPTVALAPEQVPLAFDAALNAGDLDAVLALFDDAATMRMTDGVQVAHGKPALREALAGLLTLRPRIRNRVRLTLASGDTALVLMDWTVAMTLPDGSEVAQAGVATQVMARGADGAWRLRISNPLGTAAQAEPSPA